MAFSSTKPITLVPAVEGLEILEAFHLLGLEAYNRANGGRLNHLLPILEKFKETAQARAASSNGSSFGDVIAHAQDGYVTTEQAAEAAGISGRGVRYALDAGQLEGRRIGRSRQVSVASLALFIERRQKRKEA
jgi:hypothetical protein